MKWCACSWQNHLQSTTHSYGISESRMSNQNLPQVLVGTAAKEIACKNGAYYLEIKAYTQVPHESRTFLPS